MSEIVLRPRSRSILMGLILIMTMAIVIAACRDNGREPSRDGQEPSREDLIQAVRNHVNGKSYNKTVTKNKRVTKYESRPHRCTEEDVARDPHMPRNPELADCPRVGAIDWRDEPVTVTEPVAVTETHTCSSLPGPEAGWSVTSTGNDTWRVSHGGSAWDVTKADGRADGVEGVVRVSEFAFKIKPHQDC
jgi:hypothetical protein